jgi:hypothetical protein
VRSLSFVVVAPGFVDVNLVANGAADLFRDVFGEQAGLGGRATIGVACLAHNHCFENWLTVEIAGAERPVPRSHHHRRPRDPPTAAAAGGC